MWVYSESKKLVEIKLEVYNTYASVLWVLQKKHEAKLTTVEIQLHIKGSNGGEHN